MTNVRERWLSKRAAALHVAVLLAVPGCAIAAWWQVNRAEDGNQLSYLYSVMWPVFGLLVIVFWWMLIHTDYEAAGLKGMRRQQAAQSPASDAVLDHNGSAAPPGRFPEMHTGATADEDPELASYNARLAALAAKGPKTWRHREEVVVRRPQ
jgi:hypothetical protein